jgi:hypothetical protein
VLSSFTVHAGTRNSELTAARSCWTSSVTSHTVTVCPFRYSHHVCRCLAPSVHKCLFLFFDDLGFKPNKGKEFISSLQCPECHWCPPSLLFSGYGEFPSCAKVKNEWIFTSAPPLCLHGAYRATLPVYLLRYSHIVLAFPLILCVVCYYILSLVYIVLVYNLILYRVC